MRQVVDDAAAWLPWTVFGLTFGLVIHGIEFGAACQRALTTRASTPWAGWALVVNVGIRYAFRPIATAGLLLVFYVAASILIGGWVVLKPWAVLVILAGLAVVTEWAWARRASRSLARWEERCASPEVLGHHGDNARIVGWRAARLSCRWAAAAIGLSFLVLPILGTLVRAFYAEDLQAIVICIAVVVLLCVLLALINLFLIYLDPLARLARVCWYAADRAIVSERSATALDRVMNPLQVVEHDIQSLRRVQRDVAWVAALALKRASDLYPVGSQTHASRATLLRGLAAPAANVPRRLADILDAVLDELPGVTVSDDIVKRTHPPFLLKTRYPALWLGGLAAVASSAQTVVKVARDLF